MLLVLRMHHRGNEGLLKLGSAEASEKNRESFFMIEHNSSASKIRNDKKPAIRISLSRRSKTKENR